MSKPAAKAEGGTRERIDADAAKPNPALPAVGVTLPRATRAQRDRATRALALLATHYPHAHCELVHSRPHELLVATILSAQATDVSVNKATPALFAAFKTPTDFAASTPEAIEPYIKSIGLFRSKAKAVQSAMRDVVERFGGQVPPTMDELLTLRGVARKTAGVVLGNAFGINMNVVVDTHVHRLSQRLGLVKLGANVQQTERALMASFPRESWCDLSHRLIFHGRYACKARGVACGQHPICAELGQRCELRVSAKSARMSEDAGRKSSTVIGQTGASDARKTAAPKRR